MSLAALIAKQKAAAQEKENAKAKPAELAPSTHTPSVPAPIPTGAAGVPRLGFVKPKAAAAATGGSPEPTPTSPPPERKAQSSDTVATMTLDDISDDESNHEVGRAADRFRFDDEIDATAPERELSPDLTKQQLAFISSLNGIYEVLRDPDLLGQMIRVIMQEMQEHPDYVNLMADQDVHTMIRGLRESMGLAKIKKADKQVKARGTKKTPATSQMVGTLDELYGADDW